jgi:hypothetical protein
MLMPVLVALAIGVGVLRGGSLRNFAGLDLRWIPLVVASFALQLLLFTPFLHRPLLAVAVEPLYVLSMLMVAAWVALNWRVPGMPLIAVGLLSNLVAIVANGGHMPISPAAARYAGSLAHFAESNVSNNSLLAPPEQVRLWILTDILPLPQWFPLANVFSVGDVLLAAGLATLCYRTVRQPLAAKPGHLAEVPPAGVSAGRPE